MPALIATINGLKSKTAVIVEIITLTKKQQKYIIYMYSMSIESFLILFEKKIMK